MERHTDLHWDYRMYILILLLPVIIVCSIRNLKYLSPCSVLANVLEFVGLGIIFYFILSESLLQEYQELRHIRYWLVCLFACLEIVNNFRHSH